MRINTISILVLAAVVGVPAHADDTDKAVYPSTYFIQFHPTSALDMVRRLPGFSFDLGDPSRRGMAEASGNVVIDGKRVADKTFTLDEVLARIPAAQVERVELIRNGSSGIDMLGQPLVANVIRKSAGAASAALSFTSGVFSDGRFTPGITVERLRRGNDGRSLSLSASVSRYVELNKGDGKRRRFDALGNKIEEARVDAAAGGTTGYAQATSELPGLGGQLRLNGTLTWTSYRDRQVDRMFLPAPVIATLDEDLGGVGGGQGGAEIGVRHTRAFGSKIESEITISGRIGRKRYTSVLTSPGAQTEFALGDNTGEAVARAQVRYKPGTSLTVAFDWEAAYNRLNTRSALAFNEFVIPLPNGTAEVSEQRRDAGMVATWQVGPRVELQAGLHQEVSRIDAESDTDLTATYRFFRPNFHLHWTPRGRQQLRLRVERAVGQLDFTNFAAAASLDKGVVSAGNTALKPDNAWIAEANYEWRSPSEVTVLINYRHSWLRDVIDRIPVLAPGTDVASYDAPGNIGSGREDLVSLDATVPLKSLLRNSELKVSATYRRDRVTDPTTGTERPISNLKPFVLTADFHQDLPHWKAAWGATLDVGWHTRTYLYNEIDTNSAGALLTVFADWNPQPNLSFHIEASDLLSRGYRRTIDYSGGPRNLAELLYRDNRQLSIGPSISVKARRSF